jgi:hypothetical protein
LGTNDAHPPLPPRPAEVLRAGRPARREACGTRREQRTKEMEERNFIYCRQVLVFLCWFGFLRSPLDLLPIAKTTVQYTWTRRISPTSASIPSVRSGTTAARMHLVCHTIALNGDPARALSSSRSILVLKSQRRSAPGGQQRAPWCAHGHGPHGSPPLDRVPQVQPVQPPLGTLLCAGTIFMMWNIYTIFSIYLPQ